MDKIIDMFYVLFILLQKYTVQTIVIAGIAIMLDIIIYNIFGNSLIKQLRKLYYNNIK